VVAVAEDYLALKVGGEAAGLSMDDLKQIGMTTFDEMKDNVSPMIQDVRHRLQPEHA
jgi:hypothetical protein